MTKKLLADFSKILPSEVVTRGSKEVVTFAASANVLKKIIIISVFIIINFQRSFFCCPEVVDMIHEKNIQQTINT